MLQHLKVSKYGSTVAESWKIPKSCNRVDKSKLHNNVSKGCCLWPSPYSDQPDQFRSIFIPPGANSSKKGLSEKVGGKWP